MTTAWSEFAFACFCIDAAMIIKEFALALASDAFGKPYDEILNPLVYALKAWSLRNSHPVHLDSNSGQTLKVRQCSLNLASHPIHPNPSPSWFLKTPTEASLWARWSSEHVLLTPWQPEFAAWTRAHIHTWLISWAAVALGPWPWVNLASSCSKSKAFRTAAGKPAAARASEAWALQISLLLLGLKSANCMAFNVKSVSEQLSHGRLFSTASFCFNRCLLHVLIIRIANTRVHTNSPLICIVMSCVRAECHKPASTQVRRFDCPKLMSGGRGWYGSKEFVNGDGDAHDISAHCTMQCVCVCVCYLRRTARASSKSWRSLSQSCKRSCSFIHSGLALEQRDSMSPHNVRPGSSFQCSASPVPWHASSAAAFKQAQTKIFPCNAMQTYTG